MKLLPLPAELRSSSIMHLLFSPSRLPVPGRMARAVEPGGVSSCQESCYSRDVRWTVRSKPLPPLQGELSQAASALHFIQPTPLHNHGPVKWWWPAHQQLLNMVGGETKLGHTHLVHADWSARGSDTDPAGEKVWLPRNAMSVRKTHEATLK